MNKLIHNLFVALVVSVTGANAQIQIDINDNGFRINDQIMKSPLLYSGIKDVLGNPSEVFEGINTIYTYNIFGIRFYVSREDNIDNSLYIDFVKGPYPFSPKNVFSGNIELNGYKITKELSSDSLIRIPNIHFDLTRSGIFEDGTHRYNIITSINLDIAFYFSGNGMLENVYFGYTNSDNKYEMRSQEQNNEHILRNIDFQYEQGEWNNGNKVGVWDYYDTPNRLSLKYDHDKNEVLYLEKTENDFVIKDGIIWDRSNLESYPRIIGSYFEFNKSLAKQIDYPAEARRQRITGTCYVSFIIDKFSRLRDLKIEFDIGGNCGEAVIKAMNSIDYSWLHASKNNLSYDSKFILPVTFSLLEKQTPALIKDQLYLPEANRIPEIRIIAVGAPNGNE